jgi:cyclopropane fatty-acyl-phospholipid synthase-like methyltransferase
MVRIDKCQLSAVRALRTLASSGAEEQVEELLKRFRSLKENFDRGVGLQMFKFIDTNSEHPIEIDIHPTSS